MKTLSSGEIQNRGSRRFLGINLDKRAGRRRLIGVLFAAYLGITVSFWAAFHVHRLWCVAAIGFIVLMALSYVALSGVVRAYALNKMPPGVIGPIADERQAHVRDRAFVSSYQILAAITSFATFYWILAQDFSWYMPSSPDQLQAIFWGVILVTAALPSVVIAWQELGPDDELLAE
jgi:MFS family permease